ncbi:1-acyl-sn-glycerol-3-phosphate acyltransferase [Labilithrix luteola]|uniref:1-acyl-sn-glycerol-3-phosphate acyltransferase n=1 Tax=Labilithrix luteola TaxID=1391654 RepID=UPI000AD1D390|nr:1-acyl-sn-glycerol-3-phosphate acyltransferase [Labilithrix luteola]
MSAPIFDFNAARSSIVDEVVNRICAQTKDPLHTLNEAAYLETRRLQHDGGAEHTEWRQLAAQLGRLTDHELRERLRGYAQRYAWDVAGNFDRRVYKFASRAMAPLLGALLSPRSTIRHIHESLDLTALDSRIVVQGPREHIRKLTEIGTVVYVPTHLSNLDSVVFGFALERAGLPPAVYGAGKNLFTNPVLSYFMHNLGAYRVDRRLRHALYKDVLKTYSAVLIERGYHSLFFPGGTRSRSGGVERKLKLGLAGTGLEAFVRTTVRGRTQKVFFVPATINYLLTLEAETLIDDFLQEEGKARYLIEDDESTRIGRVAAFSQKLLGLDGACVIRFSRPLDCFGNFVDDEGISHDERGREVDATSYIVGRDGKPAVDHTRDVEYTRELGERVVDAFRKDTVVMATHIVAACAFARLRRAVGEADLFSVLRHRDDVTVRRAELAEDVDAMLDKLNSLEERGEIVVAPTVKGKRGEEVLSDALRAFAGYHSQPVLSPRGSELVLRDTRLLFYYQNRLAAHGLAFDALAPKGSPSRSVTRPPMPAVSSVERGVAAAGASSVAPPASDGAGDAARLAIPPSPETSAASATAQSSSLPIVSS